MKQKKYCTYPLGYIIIIMFLFIDLLSIGELVILYLDGDDGWWWGFLLLLFVLVPGIYFIKEGYFNFVKIDASQIKHKNEAYNWEEVYITMYSFWATSRRSNPYFIYFSNHYLTQEEIDVHIPKSNGFYIMLTKKRADYLLKYYRKEVMILNENGWQKQILNIVKRHNDSIKNRLIE